MEKVMAIIAKCRKTAPLLLAALIGGLGMWLTAIQEPRPTMSDLSQVKVFNEVAVNERTKYVALTFDDGPHPQYTREILRILSQYHAQATFFVVGKQVTEHPEILKEIIKGGNQVGNHCYEHIDYRHLLPCEFYTDLLKTEKIISRATALTPTVFRPPLGKYNTEMVQMVKDRGYKFILWSYATNSEDSWKNPPTDYIVNTIVNGVYPGAIVLLHDFGGDRRTTVEAVRQVLIILTKRGYKFVTLNKLFSAADSSKVREVTSKES